MRARASRPRREKHREVASERSDRREFLKVLGAGAVAAGVPAWTFARPVNPAQEPTPPVRDPRYREWSAVALAEAKRLGCSYADIRFTRNRSQSLTLRNGQIFSGGGRFGGDGFGGRGGGGTVETYGFGIRVIHGGVWGFASSPLVTPEEIKRVAGVATDIARASAVAKKTDVRLAPVEKYDEYWQMPFERIRGRCRSRRRSSSSAASRPRSRRRRGSSSPLPPPASSTNGSTSRRAKARSSSSSSTSATARRRRPPGPARRSRPATTKRRPAAATSTSIKCDLPGQADRIAAEAIEHSKAKPVGQGVKDLVLMPSHLALTIHEIVAHADRARSHRRLRGQLRRDELRQDCRRRQAEIRIAEVQHHRRPDPSRRHGHRRFRR